MSAIEIMLRSMGLNDVMDTVSKLQESGALEQVMAFATGLEETNKLLRELRDELRRWNNEPSDVEPGSGPAVAGPVADDGARVSVATGTD